MRAYRWIGERHRVLSRVDVCMSPPFPSLTESDRFAPCGLWLLGEKGYEEVNLMVYRDTMTGGERLECERIRSLFPEAKVRAYFLTIRDIPPLEF
jgi:hypothetical protein